MGRGLDLLVNNPGQQDCGSELDGEGDERVTAEHPDHDGERHVSERGMRCVQWKADISEERGRSAAGPCWSKEIQGSKDRYCTSESDNAGLAVRLEAEAVRECCEKCSG